MDGRLVPGKDGVNILYLSPMECSYKPWIECMDQLFEDLKGKLKKWKSLSRVWLSDPMDCSPLGSCVLGDSPGKNTGVGCHVLLQGIFPTQRSNSGLPHCKQILYHLSHQESPKYLFYWAIPGLSCSMWDLASWPGINPQPPSIGSAES